jgi:hypothetical protein
MTTGTQQEGQQCLLTWAEWWYEQTHWTKWAPKQPDSPHRLKDTPQPRPYLRLPEEPFDLDSFIASLSAEYRGVVRGNQIEWVPAPGAPPATRWAFQFHYDADEFTAITTAVVRVVARTPMQRRNDRKIDALRIAEFKGDPPTEAYLQPLIDGPAHRALARRASRQLEQDAAKHVRQQDDAAIRRFPAKKQLSEDVFLTYVDILARRWAPPSKKALAPARTEALSNAVLDILSRASYRTKPFPNFEAFAAWLYRWQHNMARRAGLRVAGLDIDAPGAMAPFITQKQPTVCAAGEAPPDMHHGRLVPHTVIERTEQEATRRPYRLENPLSEDSAKFLTRWASEVEADFKRSLQRWHHDGEPGVPYSEWHWSWYWKLLVDGEPSSHGSLRPTYGIGLHPACRWTVSSPFIVARSLPTESPDVREITRKWDEWAYPDGKAHFHEYEGPIHWPTAAHATRFERQLTEWLDERFAYFEQAQAKDRYTLKNALKNPHQCDRGYAEPKPAIHEAVTDQAAIETLFPAPTRVVVAKRIERIERGIAAGRRELERTETTIYELKRTHKKADKRRDAAALAQRRTGATAALTAAERHYATLDGQLVALVSRRTHVNDALSKLNRLRDELVLQKKSLNTNKSR